MSPAEPAAGSPRTLFGLVTEALGALGTVWIFLLMVLINFDVFGRFLFNRPLVGATEIVTMSIVGIVYLQLGQALRQGRFIRSDVMIGRMLADRPRAGYALQAMHHLVGAVVLGLMVYFCVPETRGAWEQGEYIGTEGVFVLYVWPIDVLVTVGAAVTAIQFVLLAVRDIRVAAGLIRPPAPIEEPEPI